MDDRFAELLEQHHNRLRSRQEPGNGGVEPRAEIKRRLDEAEECLRLIERVRRVQGCSRSSADPAFRPVESIGPDRCRIGRFEIIVELGRGAHGIVFLAWDPAGATAGCTEDAASGRIVHVGAAKTVPARGYRGRAADARQHYFRARSRSVRTGLLHRQCILRRQVVGRVAGRDYGVHSAARRRTMDGPIGRCRRACSSPRHLASRSQAGQCGSRTRSIGDCQRRRLVEYEFRAGRGHGSQAHRFRAGEAGRFPGHAIANGRVARHASLHGARTGRCQFGNDSGRPPTFMVWVRSCTS